MVGVGAAVASSARPARGRAGSVTTSVATALNAISASRMIDRGTFLDYPDPISASQETGRYSGPPTTRMLPRSIATLLSARRTDARISNSPAGRSRTMKK